MEFLLKRRELEGPIKARAGSEPHEIRKCVDTAIIKFYVDLGGDGLSEFLGMPSATSRAVLHVLGAHSNAP